MDAIDIVQKFTGALGVVGAGVAGEVFRRFRTAEKSAKSALKKSSEALEKATTALAKAESLSGAFDDIRQAFRLEVDNIKQDIEERFRPFTRNSRPDLFYDERRFDELKREMEKLHQTIQEVKSDLVRERGQRHALQKDVQDLIKSEAESWRVIDRTLGRLESMMETHKEQMKEMRESQTRRSVDRSTNNS